MAQVFLFKGTKKEILEYAEKYNLNFSVIATPAEGLSGRFTNIDKAIYGKIKGVTDKEYYTNSSHLPVGYTEDVFSALDIQDKLQTLYTSGTVFHAFLGQKLPDWKAAANLVRKIAENYKLPYYTMSPTYSVCSEHGYLEGEHYKCPICGKTTEVYSRITGYYRPVQNWNDGKAQEFKDRKTIGIEDVSDAIEVILKKTKHEDVLESFKGYRERRAASREAFVVKQQHKYLFKR